MGVPDAYLPQNDIARAAVIVGDGQGVRIVAQTFHSKGKKRLVVLVNMLVFQNQFIPPLQNSQDIWRVAEKKNTRIIVQLPALRLTGRLHHLPEPPDIVDTVVMTTGHGKPMLKRHLKTEAHLFKYNGVRVQKEKGIIA